MLTSEEENIDIYKYQEQGGFNGSLTGKWHSRFPFDQAIEKTVIRLCKNNGGLSENKRNPGVAEMWTKYSNIWLQYMNSLTRKSKWKQKKTF